MSENPTTCEEVIEHLFAFLDRELDEETSAHIDAHLQRCRDCFTRAEFERRLRARVHDAADVKAPETLRRRLRKVLDTF